MRHYNYVNTVKNLKDDGGVNVHYYSDADEDEIEAKLESIQGLLDALREEEDEEEEERTTTNKNSKASKQIGIVTNDHGPSVLVS